MYLITTIISVLYLYIMDKNFDKLAFVLVLFPVIFFYFQIPAFQYNVGTDYMSYVDMYKYGYNIEYYFNKKELIFYSILKIVTGLKLGEQSIFILVSIVYSIFWAYFVCLLKSSNYKVWIIVFLYFCITGIYQNQLNGLRQYMAIAILPCIFILLYRRKFISSFILTIIASLCHATFVLLYPFYIFLFIKPSPYRIGILFFISFIFSAVIIPKVLPIIVGALFGNYAGYFDSALSESANISSLVTKLYYFPLFVLAILMYKKDLIENSFNHKHDMIMRFFMILSVTYWLFIVNMYFGFFGRVAQYFMIFYIFPIYYLIERYIDRGKLYSAIITVLYISAPYVLKVTIFATSEYDYQSILGNF